MSEIHGKSTRVARADRCASGPMSGYEEGGGADRSLWAPPSLSRWCCSTRSKRAHSDVFKRCSLQVLDDGRLTDGQGRVVDFGQYAGHQLTSNLGSLSISTNLPGRRGGPATV